MERQLNIRTRNLSESEITHNAFRKDPCMSDLLQAIHEGLSPREILEIDLRSLGGMICRMAIALSRKVNEELLSPISKWLNDPEWITRFSVCEENAPNWALYKRRHRHLTKRQKAIFAERMKIYWFEIRQRFCQALNLSISDLLPWKFLMTFSLSRTRNLSDLPVHYPENRKKDIVSKLIHLLHMEADDEVSLTQTAPFGEIIIEPNPKLRERTFERTVTIIDKHGETYEFDWQQLTVAQRTRVIADIKGNKILCKVAE